MRFFEERSQEALHNYFDMRQGKAKAVQDYINREETISFFTSELDEDRP